MAKTTGIEWTAALFGVPLPRRCRGCGETKPVDGFKVDRSRPDGHAYVCRSCERVSPASVPNRIERSAAAKDGRAWCSDCSDWRSSAVVRNGRCREHNRIEERRRYREDAVFRESRRGRGAARRRGVDPVPPFGREALLELFEGSCAYCPAPATTWDHVVPVAKGGETTPDNVLPACSTCNSSKRDRDLLAWLSKTGRELHPVAVDRLSHFQVL